MERTRTIEISALNIAMHKPHSEDRYVSLFNDAFKEMFVFSHGELHRLMFGTLFDTSNWQDKSEITGQIYRFVRIDSKEPWFDTRTGKPADSEVLETIKIPDHVSAHLQIFSFVFYPKEHQLWYASKDKKDSLSPLVLEKFFQALFDKVSALKQYPRIAVTAMPEHGLIEEMLAWPRLSKLIIQLKRPNADDGYEAEQELMELMEDQNLSSITTELVSIDGHSIVPNEKTKQHAKAASRNGLVIAQGVKPDGTKGKESTVDKPMRLMRKIKSIREGVLDVIRRAKDD